MAKRQRVFKGGTEYQATGPAGNRRRVVFLASVKLMGREIPLFRPLKKIKKQRP